MLIPRVGGSPAFPPRHFNRPARTAPRIVQYYVSLLNAGEENVCQPMKNFNNFAREIGKIHGERWLEDRALIRTRVKGKSMKN